MKVRDIMDCWVKARERFPTLALRVFRMAVLMCAALAVAPTPSFAAGPDAVLTPTGYAANAVARGDDTSNLVVNLPFAMNWNGTSYTQIYINMNGNCTFGGGFTGYNPNTSTLAGTNRDIMAPFWADVDTRNTGAAQVTYSSTTPGSIPQVNGRDAFMVNWIDVASYNNQATPTNSFQLVLVDRSDTGAGNFDFMFNYDRVAWDIATAASNRRARVGWGQSGTGFELPGSGAASTGASTLLDSSDPATSLIQNSLDSGGQLGRYVWQVRGGQAPNVPPTISAPVKVFEGNATGGYVGYDGSDVVIADSDGTVVTTTNDLPVVLPLGATSVAWTATDDDGAVTTRTQSITVTDTTAPSAPTLSSPTHTVGVWSSVTTVRVDATGTADVCSGVSGASYDWFSGSAGDPDVVPDASTVATHTGTVTASAGSQTFPTATWPTDWVRSSTTYVRLTNVAGRTRSTYAAEVWANNNTRRTADFYRDYDLTGYTTATLTFWDSVSTLANGTDYARVEYSTNGGASYTQLQNLTAASAWTQRTYALPVGGTVRVRFSASVNRATEYADWDDIEVTTTTTSSQRRLSATSTRTLSDGTWYFGMRSVDVAGNWSPTTSMGPFRIDTVAPVTTDNASAGWSNTPVVVTLSANDAGVVDYTRYSIDGGAWVDYTAPVPVSAEGTTSIRYFSADEAGHVESTRTVLVRIDTGLPTASAFTGASAVSTASAEVTWSGSLDALSGVAFYRIYRDGSVVATTTGLSYTDMGLTAGQEYVYHVRAVDLAGNESLPGPQASVRPPTSEIWLRISETDVDFGTLEPGVPSALPSATVVTVGGVGPLGYNLSYAATDFTNADVGSSTPTMPVTNLAYATRGWLVTPSTLFGAGPAHLSAATGAVSEWQHPYVFDLTVVVPWTYEPGTYTTSITYTAVAD